MILEAMYNGEFYPCETVVPTSLEDRKRTEEQLTKDIDAQELAIFRKVLKQMIRNME